MEAFGRWCQERGKQRGNESSSNKRVLETKKISICHLSKCEFSVHVIVMGGVSQKQNRVPPSSVIVVMSALVLLSLKRVRYYGGMYTCLIQPDPKSCANKIGGCSFLPFAYDPHPNSVLSCSSRDTQSDREHRSASRREVRKGNFRLERKRWWCQRKEMGKSKILRTDYYLLYLHQKTRKLPRTK